MPDTNAFLLREALERLQAGEQQSGDMELVRQARRDGQVVLAAGSHSVAIGGSVTHSVIITSDNVQFNLPIETVELLGISIREIERRLRVVEGLVSGLGKIQTAYAASVRNFLEYYLGTPERPAPFGGRDADLQALDNWLANPAAPPYACLVAPAGRGKSALLAHWVQRLEIRPEGEWQVVYFPISVRYSTNLESTVFAALASRLAHLHGENITQVFSADLFKGLFQDYLRRPLPNGKRLLIVLDGLDEAAGWPAGADLLPTVAPPRLRAIIAARPLANDPDECAWLNRLGWEAAGKARLFGLERLTPDGLRDVLHAMGDPLDRLATKVDVVSQLHTLSEGDPLLMRLYVEALLGEKDQAPTLTPEDLLKLQPGLRDYFNKWFTEQEKLWGERRPLHERTIRGLLNLCATARGPLHRRDILALAPEIFEDSLLIEDAAGQVNRFVIGDGLCSGYVFSHPRLGEYFAGRLTPEEHQGWEQRFLHYGRKTVIGLRDGHLAAKDASAYIVRYYGVHLSEVDAPAEDFYPLLHKAWRDAWEWVDGTPSGFLSDARRAWDAAERSGVIGLGCQMRSLLCIASVSSQSANILGELLEKCVEAGVISPAVGIILARQKPEASERGYCLARLSYWVVNPTECRDIQIEAYSAILTIENEYDRGEALAKLAPQLVPELLPLTLEAARAIEDESARAWVLARLAEYLPSELLPEALQAAQAIVDETARALALAGLTSRLPKLLPRTLQAAQTIDNDNVRAQVLAKLAPQLPSELFTQALVAVQEIGDENASAQALAGLAPYLVPELLSKVLEMTWELEDKSNRAMVLGKLAYRFPELCPQALDAVQAIGDENASAQALARLASYLVPELLSKVLEITWELEDESNRAMVLGELAYRFPELFPQALAAAQAIKEEVDRAMALSGLAEFLPSELHPEVLEAAQAFVDETARALALQGLSLYIAPELLPQALESSQAIDNVLVRAQVMTVLALRLPELLPRALAGAQVIGDGYLRVLTLAKLVWDLPEFFPRILAAARAIDDAFDRAQVLIELAKRLPELFPQALDAVQAIEPESGRARAWFGLVENLPLELLPQALKVAQAIEDESARACAVAELAENLPPKLLQQSAPELLPQTLAAVQAIEDETPRAFALSGLAEYLPSELLPEALQAAQAIVDETARARTLSRLAQRLPELYPQALGLTQAIEDESARAWALAGLAENLPPEFLPQALAATEALDDEFNRARAISSLAHRLPELLPQALAAAQAIEIEANRAIVLSELIPCLPVETFPQVLATARAIKNESSRAQVFSKLIPFLPSTLLPEVFYGTFVISSGNLELSPELIERWEEMSHSIGISELDALTQSLHAFSNQQRPYVLKGICTLVPLIVRLGGVAAAEETALAILNVGEWWP